MNRLIKNALILVASLTISMHSMALGLGELTLKSTLNRPLEAEIQLLDAEGLSTWEIKPTLASQQVFAEVGVERPYFLTQIRFSVVGDKIRLTTKDAVTEPFLDFLVELNWPSGRVMREYTVLLDPPTFDDELYEPLAETPDSGETQLNGGAPAAQTPAPSVAESSRLKTPTPTARPAAAPGEYLVKPRDTLWSIALQTRPDRSISPQQMMLAIQRQNPNAFIKDNINLLKSNERLKIPSEADINSMTFRQAVAEVARQNQAFQAGVGQIDATAGAGNRARANTRSTGGEVRLVTPDNQEGRSAGASGDVGNRGGSGRAQALENELAMTLENLDKSTRENAELTQQLKDLEEQIEAMQKLVSLKDDQLTNIQVNAGQTDNIAAEVPPALNANTDAANDAATPGAPATPAVPAEPKPAERSPNFGKLDRYKAPPEPSIFDLLLSPMVLGVLLALLLGAGGYVYWKRRQSQDDDQEVAGMAEGPELDEASPPEGADDFNFQEAPSGEKDDFAFGDFNEGSAGTDDGLQLPDNLFGPEESNDGLDLTLDDLAAQELEGLDEVETDSAKKDPLEKADYAIAYGNFDEAEEILADALNQEPDRADLRLKRLELLATKDDAVGFDEEERSIKKASGDAYADQIEEYRARLTGAAVAAGAAGLAAEALSDDASASLDSEVNEETIDFDATLDEGLDFADALDLSDSESSLDDLELDESLLDVSDETPSLDTDDIPDLADLDLEDSPTTDSEDDGLEFDLSGLDDLEFDTSGPGVADAGDNDSSDDTSLEFDLEGLDELTTESTSTESQPEAVQAEDDNLLDFDLGELDLPETAETESQPIADKSVDAVEEDAFDLDLELSDNDSLELGSSDEESLESTPEIVAAGEDEPSASSVPELDLSSFDFDFPETRSNESSVAEAVSDSDSAIAEPDDESMDFDLGELDSSDLQTLDDALASSEESTDVSAVPSDGTEELALDEELDFSLDDLDELTSVSDAAIETKETNAPDPVADTQSEETEAFDLGDLDFDLDGIDEPASEVTEATSSEEDTFDLADLEALDFELDEASSASEEESLSIPEVTETTDAAEEFNLADLEVETTSGEQEGADAVDLSNDLGDAGLPELVETAESPESEEEGTFDLADLEDLEESAFDLADAEESLAVEESDADLEAFDLSLDETVDLPLGDETSESVGAEVAEIVHPSSSEAEVDILDLDVGDISELDLNAFAAEISDDDLTIDEDNLDDLFGANDVASSGNEVVADESESEIGLPGVSDTELEAPEAPEVETVVEDSNADEFDLEDFDLGDLDVDDLEDVSALDGTQVEVETLAENPAATPASDSSLDDLDMDNDDFDFLGGNDESATKLDLARAYVDMGDAEGARELLDEVIKDGTADQQKEAQSMLESIS